MNKLFFLALLACLSTGAAQAQRVPYNSNDKIEIELFGLRTILYPDRERPRTDFWYVPGALFVAREMADGRSRLAFELSPKPGANGSATPDSFLLNLRITSSYNEALQEAIAKQLVTLGRSITDAFDPRNSHKLVSLHPISEPLTSISFEEVFKTSRWDNRKAWQGGASMLDRPLPVQLTLSSSDVTILMESLLKNRTARVGRLSTRSGLFIPFYLGLEFAPGEDPLMASRLQAQMVRIINPTEHPVRIDQLSYEDSRGSVRTLSVDKTIKAWLQQQSAPYLDVTLPAGASLQKVHWTPVYDFPGALRIYTRQMLPETQSRLFVSGDLQQGMRLLAKTGCDSLKLRCVSGNPYGLQFSRLIALEETDAPLTLTAPGGVSNFKARIEGRGAGGEKLTGFWNDLTPTATGEALSLRLSDLGATLAALPATCTPVPVSGVQRAFLLYDEESRKWTAMPAVPALAQTDDGATLYEISVAGDRLSLFAEAYLPLFPADQIALRSALPPDEPLHFATLDEVSAQLFIHGKPVGPVLFLETGQSSHFRFRHTASGDQATLIQSGVEAGEAWLRLKLRLGLQNGKSAELISVLQL